MNNHKHQKGFSIVEGLLFLVLAGIIAGTGWYVWRANKNANKTLNEANKTSSSQISLDKSASETYAGWKTNASLPVFNFKYPEDWQIDQSYTSGGISLKSSNFVAEVGYSKISKGSVLSVFSNNYGSDAIKDPNIEKDLLNFANDASMSTEANIEYFNVAGYKAIYFTHEHTENSNNYADVMFTTVDKIYTIEQEYKLGAVNPYPNLVKNVAATFSKR